MTDYSNIPQVNALYLEQQQVQSAIDYLNTGGAISMMVISPPTMSVTPSDDPMPPPPSMMMQMAVSIPIPPPNPPDLVTQALTALYDRNDAIDQQLADLGVTNPPVVQRQRN
jgi:hypothetical protein